jgi:hypothetical protein
VQGGTTGLSGAGVNTDTLTGDGHITMQRPICSDYFDGERGGRALSNGPDQARFCLARGADRPVTGRILRNRWGKGFVSLKEFNSVSDQAPSIGLKAAS